MGYNTTVVVMNDSLDAIATDPQFGANLKNAILGMSLGVKPKDVVAGNHINAATVIETHHADHNVVVVVGGNYGRAIGHCHGSYLSEEGKLDMLRQLAESLGYNLHKKPVCRKHSVS